MFFLGDVEECKKLLNQGVDINYVDTEGNSGIFHATLNNQLEILRFLEANNAAFEMINKSGNTPLHLACEKSLKEAILFLILAGVDQNLTNTEGKKAGDGNIEVKMLVNGILAESKAFRVLNPLQKKKLIQIFEDIDTDGKKLIDLNKSILFNKYVDDNVNDSLAEKDGKDFIKWCAILNKETVNRFFFGSKTKEIQTFYFFLNFLNFFCFVKKKRLISMNGFLLSLNYSSQTLWLLKNS